MQASLKLPAHKTKIICTIGPASCTPSVLKRMIESGMSVARLNFSHGGFKEHAENIRNIRAVASQSRREVSIIIDLPVVKMRIGRLQNEPVVLKESDKIVLTAKNSSGSPFLLLYFSPPYWHRFGRNRQLR